MLPAISFLVQLWNLPYFSAKILLQNVVCIIFGFPADDENLSLILSQIQDSPDIYKSFHIFLLDVFDFKVFFLVFYMYVFLCPFSLMHHYFMKMDLGIFFIFRCAKK